MRDGNRASCTNTMVDGQSSSRRCRGKVVAVTGASGYIGSHICQNLVDHGYIVRACVRDASRADRTHHLLQMNHPTSQQDGDVSLTLWEADMMVEGSYDAAFHGAEAVFHVAGNFGTDARWETKTRTQGRPSPADAAMGKLKPSGNTSYDHGVYDSYVEPMQYVLDSIERSQTVKRLIFTSSGCAGPSLTESHTVQDNPYGKGKVDCEKMIYAFGRRHNNHNIVCCSSCPHHVLGPVLAPVHDMTYQHRIGEIFAGKYFLDQYWEICDVRDVADTQRRMLESATVTNGSRFYNACAPDEELTAGGFVDVLRELFPEQAGKLKEPPNETAESDSDSDSDGSSSSGSGSSSESSNQVEDEATLWRNPEHALGLTRTSVTNTIRDTIVSMQAFDLIDRTNVSTKELLDFCNVAEMDGCDAEVEYIKSQLQARSARTKASLAIEDDRTSNEYVTYNQCQEEDDSTEDTKVLRKRHGARNQHKMKDMVKWLLHTFGEDATRSVLDVAGGKGELAARLSMCHGKTVVLVDPRPADIPSVFVKQVLTKLPSKWQTRIRDRMAENPNFVEESIQERFQQLTMYFTNESVVESADLRDAIRDCTMLVGMHADSATEAIVDVAVRQGKPFVVVPCCVFPNLFSQRCLINEDGTKTAVRTTDQFCDFLLRKDARFRKDILPFEGRNVAIWWDGKDAPSK